LRRFQGFTCTASSLFSILVLFLRPTFRPETAGTTGKQGRAAVFLPRAPSPFSPPPFPGSSLHVPMRTRRRPATDPVSDPLGVQWQFFFEPDFCPLRVLALLAPKLPMSGDFRTFRCILVFFPSTFGHFPFGAGGWKYYGGDSFQLPDPLDQYPFFSSFRDRHPSS